MPTARPVPTQPSDIERERAALQHALTTRWPRAARDVLTIAGRVDYFNRRAAALGLPPLAAAEPIAAASAMWAVMQPGCAPLPDAAAADPGRRHRPAVGATAAGPSRAGDGLRGSRHAFPR